MSPIDLRDMVDTFGVDLSKWPPESRKAAEAVLATSPEAQALFCDAAAFEDALRSSDPPLPPDRRHALIDTIMASIDTEPSSS